jgi:hypothetical protein
MTVDEDFMPAIWRFLQVDKNENLSCSMALATHLKYMNRQSVKEFIRNHECVYVHLQWCTVDMGVDQ